MVDLSRLTGTEEQNKFELCFNTLQKQDEKPDYQTSNPYRYWQLQPASSGTERTADYDDLSNLGMGITPRCAIL